MGKKKWVVERRNSWKENHKINKRNPFKLYVFTLGPGKKRKRKYIYNNNKIGEKKNASLVAILPKKQMSSQHARAVRFKRGNGVAMTRWRYNEKSAPKKKKVVRRNGEG